MDDEQQEATQEPDGTPVDDGGATPGSTGEEGAQPSDPGPTDPETQGGDPVETDDDGDAAPEGTTEEEQSDRTPDGEEQTGADPQPE